MQRRRDADEHAGQHRDRAGEQDGRPVEADRREPREIDRNDDGPGAHDQQREPEADGRRDGRQGQALGEQLASQAAAPGANRGAHRELAFAGDAEREQQVRDVCTCEQQDQRDPGHEQQKNRLHRRGHLIGKALHAHGRQAAFPEEQFGGLRPRPQGASDRCPFGGRLFGGHARPKPANRPEHVDALSGARSRLRARAQKRREELAIGFGKREAGRRDADNDVRPPVERDRLTDGVGAPGELLPPVVVGEDDDMVRACDRFLGDEEPARRRSEAQDAEDLRGQHGPFHAIGVASAGDCVGALGVGAHALHGLARRDARLRT